MTSLHVYDARNHLFLTGFYPPPVAILQPALALGGSAKEMARDATADDETIGRAVTLMAREYTAPRLAAAKRRPIEAGLHTWVLSRSANRPGRLDTWFPDTHAVGRYRVLIHRTPRRYCGCVLPVLWDAVYDELDTASRSGLRTLDLSPRALRSAAGVLGEGLCAYGVNMDAVISWADELGHPYTLVV